ncbi:hypothetical protein R8Z50_10705 [Longispora sp. K20-0274]|uniref:hypothetical protein n=1 Tax=Longispora sp. K20-0274 TaxID=3088255 RepID=UPI00399BA87D
MTTIVRRLVAVLVATGALVAGVGPATAFAAEPEHKVHVSGAGHTIIEGGTGGANPVPVQTVLAVHATPSGGHFECLALAPHNPTGQDSGQFTDNVMYVTGPVTYTAVHGHSAVLRGTATVTGLGAGQNMPFTLTVWEGGPGTTVVLEISGMTFHEILLDGKITVD